MLLCAHLVAYGIDSIALVKPNKQITIHPKKDDFDTFVVSAPSCSTRSLSSSALTIFFFALLFFSPFCFLCVRRIVLFFVSFFLILRATTLEKDTLFGSSLCIQEEKNKKHTETQKQEHLSFSLISPVFVARSHKIV